MTIWTFSQADLAADAAELAADEPSQEATQILLLMKHLAKLGDPTAKAISAMIVGGTIEASAASQSLLSP